MLCTLVLSQMHSGARAQHALAPLNCGPHMNGFVGVRARIAPKRAPVVFAVIFNRSPSSSSSSASSAARQASLLLLFDFARLCSARLTWMCYFSFHFICLSVCVSHLHFTLTSWKVWPACVPRANVYHVGPKLTFIIALTHTGRTKAISRDCSTTTIPLKHCNALRLPAFLKAELKSWNSVIVAAPPPPKLPLCERCLHCMLANVCVQLLTLTGCYIFLGDHFELQWRCM